MIKVQDYVTTFDRLSPTPFGQDDRKWQWQPTTTEHDPNPPIPLETPVSASYTMVVVWAS